MEPLQHIRHLFGGYVRKLRREQHLTQAQLGLITGLTHSTISRIERGQSSATFNDIVLIASALGTTPSQLFAYIDCICADAIHTHENRAPRSAASARHL